MSLSPNMDREPLSGQKLRERALDLLSRRDHSEQELRRKLLDKGAVDEELPALMDHLKERGYLDDRRFAEHFVRYRAGKAWGRKRYAQELARRGVDSEIIESVLSTAPEMGRDLMEEKIERLIRRELDKGRPEEKVVASLLRRGFAWSLIRRSLPERKF